MVCRAAAVHVAHGRTQRAAVELLSAVEDDERIELLRRLLNASGDRGGLAVGRHGDPASARSKRRSRTKMSSPSSPPAHHVTMYMTTRPTVRSMCSVFTPPPALSSLGPQ